jgi:hypothetical protein
MGASTKKFGQWQFHCIFVHACRHFFARHSFLECPQDLCKKVIWMENNPFMTLKWANLLIFLIFRFKV